MKNKIRLSFAIISSLLIFIGCNNDTNQNKEVAANVDTTSTNKTSAVLTKSVMGLMVINDVPFPFEVLDKLYAKHVPFDEKVMNPISNYSKYSQYNSKAINLGIYGADLSYSVTYEQFLQIGQYLKNTKKLAEALNIAFAFNEDMMDKYNKFKDNKDSLTKIVFESYTKVDNALKNDQRVGISALVVTGGWLEGLYLSSQTFINTPKTDDNKSLYETIGQQKISLYLVIKLLEEYKSDAYISSLIDSLQDLSSDYNESSSAKMLNEKQLISINKKVAALRNKIIEGM